MSVKGLKFFILIALLACGSCVHKKVTVEEYISIVTKDELINQEELTENYHISCSYIPPEILAIQELESHLTNNKVTTEKFTQTVREFDKSYYFSLNIADIQGEDLIKKNISSTEEYMLFVNNLTYECAECLIIKDGEKEIKPSIYQYQRSYGLSPNAKFLFVFPKSPVEADKKLSILYQDKFFGIQKKILFEFELEKIKQRLPELKSS